MRAHRPRYQAGVSDGSATHRGSFRSDWCHDSHLGRLGAGLILTPSGSILRAQWLPCAGAVAPRLTARGQEQASFVKFSVNLQAQLIRDFKGSVHSGLKQQRVKL